jgi:hypothetical protein
MLGGAAAPRGTPLFNSDRSALLTRKIRVGHECVHSEISGIAIKRGSGGARPRTPRQGVHRPAKANSGRSSLSANHVGVLRGLMSAYSQNDVAGTMQRRFLPSHPRQCRPVQVADVRDRLAAELRRSRHAPSAPWQARARHLLHCERRRELWRCRQGSAAAHQATPDSRLRRRANAAGGCAGRRASCSGPWARRPHEPPEIAPAAPRAFPGTMERVRAALDASAERMLAPENVPRILIESLDSVGVLERTLTPRAAAGDVEALKLVAQCRRQRERTAKLILERAPTSNPV